jgi:hypothetical protein
MLFGLKRAPPLSLVSLVSRRRFRRAAFGLFGLAPPFPPRALGICGLVPLF